MEGKTMRFWMCLAFVAVAGGCGGKQTSSYPKNQDFKALQATLATNRLAVGPKANASTRSRDEAYLLRTPHEKWTMSEAATYALVRIGAPAVEQLRQELIHDDVPRRLRAIDILARIGPDAKAAVPDLVKMLQANDIRVRKYAARALGQIGPDAGVAVPDLIKALNSGK